METQAIEEAFSNVPVVNFSRMVLENIRDHLLVMEVPDVYWSDWGEEHRIFKDARRFKLNVARSIIPSNIDKTIAGQFKLI